jgi:hypothetical protein
MTAGDKEPGPGQGIGVRISRVQTHASRQLLLAPRARGESFTPADHRLRDDLARQVGIAAHAVRLTAD